MAVRRKLIRKLVEDLLRQNKVNRAPVPVHRIAQSSGVELYIKPTKDELSGFLVRDPDEGRVIIGVNRDHHENRQRFTIAHELGHYLLHEGERVHIDRNNRAYQVKLRDEEASKGIDNDEMEANLFAAELLMPASFLARDIKMIGQIDLLNEEDALTDLAEQYKVSTQALTFRLSYLNYVQL